MTINCNKPDFVIKQGTIWDGRTLYELYKEAYTPWEWHKELFEIASKEGLICFSTPFDKSAVDFLEELKVPVYKIASFEITDIPLIEYAASKGKPMIISTGIATEEDIQIIKSPVGMPGRSIFNRFLQEANDGQRRPAVCKRNCLKSCNPKTTLYCISDALLAAFKGNLKDGFAFVGANAGRVKRISTVKEVFTELQEEYREAT